LESTGKIMEVIGYDYISHIYFPYIYIRDIDIDIEISYMSKYPH
jgi:hypothetical protein